MKAVVVFALLAACKYPDPGGAGDAQQVPGEELIDGNAAACSSNLSLSSGTQVAGQQVAGFTPASDAGFAISWVTGGNPGFTTAPLGVTYSPTNISDPVLYAVLAPKNNALYLHVPAAAAGSKVQRAQRTGGAGQWGTLSPTGLPDFIPGRPDENETRIVMVDDSVAVEYMKSGTTWQMVREYSPADFGNDSADQFLSADLSPDGNTLFYTLDGPSGNGIHLRTRNGGSFASADGATGKGLMTGPYQSAQIVDDCTAMFAFNYGSSYAERFDITP